jgi:hypothetical protein
MRNVLIHNGPTVEQILGHAHALLRRGGHLLAMEIDVTELVLPDDAPDEQDLEQRWIEWARASGNDPAIGRRLARLIGQYDSRWRRPRSGSTSYASSAHQHGPHDTHFSAMASPAMPTLNDGMLPSQRASRTPGS